MQIPISDELRSILQQIIDERRTEEEWTQVEADDTFQSESFVGGFDATEQAFCFSYYDHDGDEFWFQLTIPEVEAIIGGMKSAIDGRRAG